MRLGAQLGVLWIVVFVLGGQVGYASSLIYDNGAPDQQNGNEMTQWIQAEDFTLAAGATVTDVRFWDGDNGSYNGSIAWQILADSGGSPGASLASGAASGVVRTATGNSVATIFSEFQNDFSIGSVPLASGTYWLALHNGPLTDQDRAEFYWETTSLPSSPTGHEDVAPFAGAWNDNGQEHAFQLYSEQGQTTPELPSAALALVGMAPLGLAWLRRRRAA